MSIVVNIQKKLGAFELQMELGSNSKRIGILGASGCGKSMTLQCIAGILSPDQGRIEIDGKVVYDSGEKVNLKPQKRRIGYLFQNYALFPRMTVEKNIEAGVQGTKEERKIRVSKMIEKFRLEGLEGKYPGELSGGQQQRVALARIMASEPEAILLDEPYAALDDFLKDRLQQEMQELLADYEGTVILVSHSRDEIYRFSEELIIMEEGKLICIGRTADIFANPRWKEAARLTGCKNIAPVTVTGTHRCIVEDWGVALHFHKEIPEDTKYVGIRAHDLIPVWGEAGEHGDNVIPVKEASLAKYPFEWKYFVRTEVGEELCWFVQKDRWQEIEKKGMPDYLRFPEEKVLFLRERGGR